MTKNDANLPVFDCSELPEMPFDALPELDGFEFHNPETTATVNPDVGLDADLRLNRIPAARKLIDARQVDDMRKIIAPLPAAGVTCHIVLSGKASLWDLVPAVLEIAAPAIINELWIATLGFSNRNATELFAYLDGGQVGRCHFICSHYFKGTSESIYTPMETGMVKRGQRFLAMRNHSKLILMSLSDGCHIVGESSANLRSCKNVETLTLTHDRALFEFHTRWMDHIFMEAGHGG